MILSCPNCNARFRVPDGALEPHGKKVRCAKCKHVWHQDPHPDPALSAPQTPTDAPAAQAGSAPAAPRSDVMDKPAFPQAPLPPVNPMVDEPLPSSHERRRRNRTAARMRAFFGTLLILGFSFALILMLQKPLVQHFPAAAALYYVFGLESKTEPQKELAQGGLHVSNITRKVVEEPQLTILNFRGDITNTNRIATHVPELRVTLYDARGVEIDYWPAQLSKTTLEPGETATWVCRFFNPNLEHIANYSVTFASK